MCWVTCAGPEVMHRQRHMQQIWKSQKSSRESLTGYLESQMALDKGKFSLSRARAPTKNKSVLFSVTSCYTKCIWWTNFVWRSRTSSLLTFPSCAEGTSIRWIDKIKPNKIPRLEISFHNNGAVVCKVCAHDVGCRKPLWGRDAFRHKNPTLPLPISLFPSLWNGSPSKKPVPSVPSWASGSETFI